MTAVLHMVPIRRVSTATAGEALRRERRVTVVADAVLQLAPLPSYTECYTFWPWVPRPKFRAVAQGPAPLLKCTGKAAAGGGPLPSVLLLSTCEAAHAAM